MFEYQTQEQVQQVNALLERVLNSIEQLREVIVEYEAACPAGAKEE